MTSPEFVCANWHPDHTDCKKVGRYTCKNCYLVNYCGQMCQKSHWPEHKLECKSYLSKGTWQPTWVLERREPTFIGDEMAEYFGENKYLWGNLPAIDLLRLGSNEGEGYDQTLRVLFAASGDLRNLVKTIAQLPSSYSQPLEITVNDLDFDVVARNIVLLLLSLAVEEADEAVDCIIHLWYSAFVRESDIDILQRRVRPLIEDVCGKIKGKTAESLFAKTWKFGQRSLRVVLKKSSWSRLLHFMEVPASLTVERARMIRAANTLAESRQDYRDRHMCCLSPSHRIAFNKFRHDGLLLPFGYPRHEFQVPNPTFFQTHNSWPMKDDADPRSGWSSKEVSDMSSGPATADIYGKLFLYIRGMLQSFLGRLSELDLSFRFFQLDASQLPEHLMSNSFSRIEVSNISDAGYMGIHETLFSMLPLLQTPLDNPHATLITLFMNAVEDTLTIGDRLEGLASHVTKRRLLRYLPNGPPTSPHSPEMVKLTAAHPMVTSYDYVFDRYSNIFSFREVGGVLSAAIKERHTIVDKWPFKLKLRPGQPGAQEEFDRCIGTNHTGKERYVEWERVHQGMF
ncbi:hypothetical protein BO78DRAFT_440822 [Aspergillus sclerotiicarbonarius CBS 121057]|uniref:MYND-type domain-containing protein n=1 Tax=Aspergillus sclerotiicarbonarius (strain CBS 121057 / IBT 28362) TaxID=1448318 RepID=A0A319ERI9_ASPSB|nr:hypothetical protein BO78DRAFT_440822 [Aspergillus sclerotiicarbonarius CBS 121057]